MIVRLSTMCSLMVTFVISQAVFTTNWRNLDYLIIISDMPSGTGDVYSTLPQNLNVDAAIVVSTPTELSGNHINIMW